MTAAVTLSTDALAFFHFACELFPAPESPLAFLDTDNYAPQEMAALAATLAAEGHLNAAATGPSQQLHDLLTVVSACDARVAWRSGEGGETTRREHYIRDGRSVEYRRDGDLHHFGSVRNESALAVELAQSLNARPHGNARDLRMSAGDYLVFAVFARDVREQAQPIAAPQTAAADQPMSIDEVLAYFDEPETNYVRTPSDDSWQASVEALLTAGILVKEGRGYALAAALHDLAREIVADHQQTITRCDYLDDEWLVREVSLYPTGDKVYRIGSEYDGSVVIRELSPGDLADVIAGVVTTLPNLLNPGGVMPMLKGPGLQGRGA